MLSAHRCPTESRSLMMRDKTPALDVSLLLSWWGEEEQGLVDEEDDKEVEDEEEDEADTNRESDNERQNDEEEEEGISRWFSTNQLSGNGQASLYDFRTSEMLFMSNHKWFTTRFNFVLRFF